MRPIHGAALAAAVCAALCALRTHEVRAGTVLRLGLSDLAERADTAFEGRVVQARVLEPFAGRIETEYTILEQAVHVGGACAVRVVRFPGGVLPDGRGLAIAGMPSLAPGEDVLLFLSRESAQGLRMPVGLAQGALRVLTLPDGAKRLVGSSAGLRFASAAATAVPDGPGVDYVAGLAEIAAGVAARGTEARR
ncbi:MAG: hypothetical protein JNK02_06340 [Planctomycetes bacterium]|nr:hypothetical protein [Planctomycetota bacterium]